MKIKQMILLTLLLSILMIGVVSASENSTDDVSSFDIDDNSISQADNDKAITTESKKESNSFEDDKLKASENDKSSNNAGSFTNLAEDINTAGDELKLTRNYIYSDSDSSYKDGIKINKKITIDGNGCIINGNNQARAFQITSNVILKNIQFINCHGHGSYYYSVSGNSSYSSSAGFGYGGAIYCSGSNNNITNCIFTNCLISYSYNSRYDYGSSSSSGGAICCSGSNNNITNCIFTNCLATSSSSYSSISSHSYGGAISCSGTNNITNCIFTNCLTTSSSSSSYGGAIYCSGTNNITNCIFTNCSSIYGAAIRCSGTNNITNCIFIGNNADYGGAINTYSDKLTIKNSNFTQNTANYNGGAIFCDNYQNIQLNIYKSIFTENTAKNGGAIYNKYTGYSKCTLYLINSTLDNNKAVRGMGIYMEKTSAKIQDTKFIDCDEYHTTDCTVELMGSKFLTKPLFTMDSISDFVEGSSIELIVNEKKGFTGIVTVTMSNEAYDINVKNGKGTKTVIPNLTPGTYTARLKSSETEEYASVNYKINEFTILKGINPELNINVIPMGENIVTVEVSAVHNFNENVEVKITGVTDTNLIVTVIDGKGSVSTILPNGDYIASINFNAKGQFSAGTASTTFALKTKITNENINIPSLSNPSNDGTVIITLPADATGTITLNINGKTYVFYVVNGISKIKIPNSSKGAYTLTYSGDNKYSAFTKTGTINNKVQTQSKSSKKIKITAPKKTFKRKVKVKKYTVTLKQGDKAINKATIILKVKGKKYTAKTNKNGKATFKIKKLNKKGTYKAIITYKGTKKTVKIVVK